MTIHGDYGSVEYNAWNSMIARCYRLTHHAYNDYGGRGIKVCDRWLESYPNFLEDMGRRPNKGYSLDRKLVNGNYEPDNCRWATKTEQNRNRRDSNPLLYMGELKTLAEWAEVVNIPRLVLHDRIRRRGWDLDKAMTTPPKPYGLKRPTDNPATIERRKYR